MLDEKLNICKSQQSIYCINVYNHSFVQSYKHIQCTSAYKTYFTINLFFIKCAVCILLTVQEVKLVSHSRNYTKHIDYKCKYLFYVTCQEMFR